MKKNIHLAAVTTFSIFAANSTFAHADGPLTCGYDVDASRIQCTAHANADVTEIKLNAGDCYMLPALPPVIRDTYLAKAKTAPPLDERQNRWFHQLANQKLSEMRQEGTAWEKEISKYNSIDEYFNDFDPRETIEPAVLYFMLNPVKKYLSGETFTIVADSCSIWKWSITVNGTVFDWNNK